VKTQYVSDFVIFALLTGFVLFYSYEKGYIFINFEHVKYHQAEVFLDEGNITLIDVRTPDEYRQSHIQSSINIPLRDLKKRIHEVDKSKRVLLYCQSGQRSVSASRQFADHGYQAYNLRSGINVWQSQKWPRVMQ
jgi:rhodanese-related sulfurtransferase